MKSRTIKAAVYIPLLTMGAVGAYSAIAATGASNQGGIVNTRHNMTFSTFSNGAPSAMNGFRNNYGEVCVYCHTPHGANSSPTGVKLPLWNRTMKTTTYTTYDQANLTQAIAATPGPNSLSCLSCHDGTVAIDSIINMPGSGKYDANQSTTQTDSWLTSEWASNAYSIPGATMHMAMGACAGCHSSGSLNGDWANVGYIGTNLKDEHPIGVTYPTGTHNNDEFVTMPTLVKGNMNFFGGAMTPKNLRLYNSSAAGPQVECATCHDPHGVPTGAKGTVNLPTFLRMSNSGSNLCITCHIK